jgi:hypothetical protein
MIRCQCGFVIYDGLILKMRVGQFSEGYFNIKCSRCRTWLNGLNIKLLTGEIKTDIDFRKNGKAVMDLIKA